MSESENPKKNDGVTVASGDVSVPDGGDNALLKIDSPAGRKFIRTLISGLGAVGAAFRARMEAGSIRKLGEAKADYIRIRKIAQAEKEAIDLLGSEMASKIVAAADVANSIRERADARLNFQEEKRQHNIESVAWQAAHKLPENVSEEEVNPDWIARFFESVKDVSDETMQSLWSSILAGEVAMPGKTSLRTLDALKSLSQQEAELFVHLTQFASGGRWVFYPRQTDSGVADKILTHRRALLLHECGLIRYDLMGTRGDAVRGFMLGGFLLEGKPKFPDMNFELFSIPIIRMCRVGLEISQFVPKKFPELWYIRALAAFLDKQGVELHIMAATSSVMISTNWRSDRTISSLEREKQSIVLPTMSDDELRDLFQNPRFDMMRK